eukprot:8896570-Alexandrium_andersonii.AAC.1
MVARARPHLGKGWWHTPAIARKSSGLGPLALGPLLPASGCLADMKLYPRAIQPHLRSPCIISFALTNAQRCTELYEFVGH